MHQLMVINDFLDLEVLRDPQRVLKKERVNVHSVVMGVVRMFSSSARNKVRTTPCGYRR